MLHMLIRAAVRGVAEVDVGIVKVLIFELDTMGPVVGLVGIKILEDVWTCIGMRGVGRDGDRDHVTVVIGQDCIKKSACRVLQVCHLAVPSHRPGNIQYQGNLNFLAMLNRGGESRDAKLLDAKIVHEHCIHGSGGINCHHFAVDALLNIHIGNEVCHAGLCKVIADHKLGVQGLIQVSRGKNRAVGNRLDARALHLMAHHINANPTNHEHTEDHETGEHCHHAVFVSCKLSRHQ